MQERETIKVLLALTLIQFQIVVLLGAGINNGTQINGTRLNKDHFDLKL